MQKTNKFFSKKIVMAGGHAGTTALSIIKEIVSRKEKWDIHWIGPQKAHEGNDSLTIEAKIFPDYDVKFHAIIAGKLQKRWSKYTIYSLLKVPVGLIHAFILLQKLKPDIVVSFGGYAGVPVVIGAWILRIPVVLQEQITGLGFANRLSLPFAQKVALSREEGLVFSKGKGIIIGNPVNPEIVKLKRKTLKHKPVSIFIFTGSRGSKMINDAVCDILPKLLEKYRVYHLTGDLDKDKFEKIRSSLGSKVKQRYEVFDFIDPSVVPEYYNKSDILIGRAGANTVSEIMVSGIPAILIPLTWTNYQDQVLNAGAAQERGFAEVLQNEDLTGDLLYKTIQSVNKNWGNMVQHSVRDLASIDTKASAKLVDLIVEVMK